MFRATADHVARAVGQPRVMDRERFVREAAITIDKESKQED